MWRGFFLAIGINCCILGAECLIVERAVLASSSPPPATTSIGAFSSPPPAVSGKEFVPPEWAPWTLLGGGAVVILYSFTIPKRVAGG